MNVEELVSLIISNTASQYSEEWKPDKVYTKDELIELAESMFVQPISEEEINRHFPITEKSTIHQRSQNWAKREGAKWAISRGVAKESVPSDEEIESALFEEAKRQKLDFTKTSKFAFGWRMCAKWIKDQTLSMSTTKKEQ